MRYQIKKQKEKEGLEAGRKNPAGRWLRRSVRPHLFIAALVSVAVAFTACEKDFDIKIENYKPQLVVEGYINNQYSNYNYVVLSRSLEYFSTDFQSTGVSGASVSITEGEWQSNQYVWNPATKVQMAEANVPGLPASFRKGVYFDPRVVTNPQRALLGTPGKSYLLEIADGENQYSAITTLLNPVPIDSLTSGYRFTDASDSNKVKLRITNNYKDPDTLNNTQIYFYRFAENRNNFGWGGLFRSRATGTDDLTNGEYIRLTHPRSFVVGDTITYHMASITRDVFNFWDSYSKARNNGGPFATPVVLVSNIKGSNVTGCFSGLSLSTKELVLR
jgi:hypothetical protein